MPESSVFDVHCHFVPSATREYLAEHPDIELTERGVVRGPAVLPLPPRLSDRDAFDAHLAPLAGAVVAPPPALYLEDVPGLAPRLNTDLADFARGRPGCGVLGWLPLSSPDAAVAEARRLAADPTVVGVVIGTAIGAAVADPALDPVWSALADARFGLFVHPDGDPFDARFRPLPNPSTVGFPASTTAVAVALLAGADGFWRSGVGVCLPHGGGFLPMAVGRVIRADPAASARIGERLGRIWVDGVVFGDGLLDAAAGCVGAGHVLSGSDWPFPLSLSARELLAQRAGTESIAGQAAAWCPRLIPATNGADT
ncbi:amidohydrolase family protein [Rugosimonospora acidiphila]|uniref:Amidohydrolase family protein n=1 Tax=Rugosimonospora acidiphila TaxID=556531 RepID=A0ABP9S486_9ACTN